MDKLHDWVFNYNSYTNKWNTAKREHYNDLFSNSQSNNVLSASDINVLMDLIIKTNGEPDKINKLINH